MMQQYARDEAGNVWQVDASGNPIALVQAAQSGGPQPVTIGTPDPTAAYAAPKAQVDLERARLEASQAAATAPYDATKAAADARAAVANATKAEREVAGGGAKTPTEMESIRAEALDKIRLARSLQQRSREGWFTTGFGAKIAGALGGTPAFDLAQDTETLKNAGALTRIMEMAAQNGGKNPLTPLSNSDFQALSNSLSNLNTAQSDTQYQANVQRVIDLYERAYKGAGGADIEADLRRPASGTQALATGASREERDDTASALIDNMIRRGASPDQINAALKPLGIDPVAPTQVRAAQDYLRKNPGYKGSFGDVTRTVEQSLGNRVAGSSTGAAVGGYINGAMGGFLDEAAGAVDSALTGRPMDEAIADFDQRKQASADAFPAASLAGNVLGGVTSMAAGGLAARGLGLTARLGGRAALAGDVGYGALTGAGEQNDNRLLGAGVSALAGAAGGAVGRRLAPAIGTAVGGVAAPTARFLRERGVPLTVGQIAGEGGLLGRTVKGIEDRLTGFPLIGDTINARRREGFAGFNRAAFDEGLAPINAGTGGVTGEAGIDAARAARSQAYSAALDPVQVQADAPFVGDMQAAIAAGRALPDPMSTNLNYTLPTRVGNSFDANGGLSGRDFQQSIRGLRRDARAVENLPYGYDFGQVTRQAEGALEGLLQRQSPGTLPAYNAANTANRNVEVLRDAVNRARSGTRTGEAGLFAPSQLSDAASQNARRFGNSQGTTNQPFFDLTRAGQAALPSAVPDSGTAGRLVTGALAGGAIGTGAGYAGGDSNADTASGAATGIGAALLAAAGGSRQAQRLIGAALLERPALAQQVGAQISRQGRLTGMFGRGFGTAAAQPLLP